MLIARASAGSLERLRMVLADHGVEALHPVQRWAGGGGAAIALAVLPLEHGFTTADVSVLAEADIVGDRLSRPVRKARRSTSSSPRSPGSARAIWWCIATTASAASTA